MKNIIDCACLQSYIRQILLLLSLAIIKNRMLPRQGSPATINHLSVGESGGYLPPLRWIIVKYSPIFKTARVAKKIWRIIKTIASILGRKYARIFVLEHFLFLVAHSFPRASLSENCSLLGTDNVRGQISEHIFVPNGDYCLYNPHIDNNPLYTGSKIFFNVFLFSFWMLFNSNWDFLYDCYCNLYGIPQVIFFKWYTTCGPWVCSYRKGFYKIIYVVFPTGVKAKYTSLSSIITNAILWLATSLLTIFSLVDSE